jgi:hypothetical protein
MDAVHTHITNTRLTDPKILEFRYPVVRDTGRRSATVVVVFKTAAVETPGPEERPESARPSHRRRLIH